MAIIKLSVPFKPIVHGYKTTKGIPEKYKFVLNERNICASYEDEVIIVHKKNWRVSPNDLGKKILVKKIDRFFKNYLTSSPNKR